MASDRPVSLRLAHDLLAEIDRRDTAREPDPESPGRAGNPGTRSLLIRGALHRYYEIVRRHDPSLPREDGSPRYTRGELALICDALNGVWMHDWGESRFPVGVGIALEVSDACTLNQAHVKWDVSDWQGLVARLHAASYADKIAIVDFVERFWADDPAACAVIHPGEASEE